MTTLSHRSACWLAVTLCLSACGADEESHPEEPCAHAPLSSDAKPVSIVSDAGAVHFCAVLSDGSVRCWGYNQSGQTGANGGIGTTEAPVVVPDVACASTVAVGSESTCVLVHDGFIRCWGGNSAGSLGDGTFLGRASAATVHGMRDAVAVVAGGFGMVATLDDGSLAGWGLLPLDVYSEVPMALAAIPEVVEVAGLSLHACVVHGPTGRLSCWGRNAHGELGDGTLLDRETPQDVPGLDGIVQADVAQEGTCAVRADGSVWCWGAGDLGRLGYGGTEQQVHPVRVTGIDDAEQVAMASLTTCVRRRNGRVSCWGSAAYGQVGAAAEGQAVLAAVEVPDVDSVIDLALSGGASCALRDDSVIMCWGDNSFGQLGDGTRTSRAEAAPVKW